MTAIQSHGPIGRRLVEAIQQHRHARVVDLRAFATARREVARLAESIHADADLRDLAPAHAMYVFMQHQVSILCELIGQLPELAPLTEPIERAEAEYMPEGPPISPLTRSYFGLWALFDASVGPRRETLGTCALDLGRAMALDPEYLRLLRVLQDSRMGLYVHERVEGDVQVLRELVTGHVGRYLVPSEYIGRPGEVWFARALPPPSPAFDHGVVFTTPYAMRAQGEPEWAAFLARTLPKVAASDPRAAYASLMKWGLGPTWWPEFVFEAYAGHAREVVYLTGLPDVAASRPHANDFAPEKFVDALAAMASGGVERTSRNATPRAKPRRAAPRKPATTAGEGRRATGDERHRFALNPYRDARFTSCPLCAQATKLRKYALAIHVEPETLVAQALSCRYCPHDDLIIAHQDVLEAEMAHALAERLPDTVGKPYLVLGTFDRAAWRAGLAAPTPRQEMLPALHPFREVLRLEPARWVRAPG